MSENPLLAPISSLIDYASVRPEHIEAAIPELIAEAREAVERVATTQLPATWESIVDPLEDASERLWRAWSVAGHLNAVINTPALRDAYNACLPEITAYSTWVGLHKGLYTQYRRLKQSKAFTQLTAARQRIVDMALRDFRLSGVELEGEARERYTIISDEAAQVSQKFSENALDAVDSWSLVIEDETRLDGIPQDVLDAAKHTQSGSTAWTLTLKMPCYLPVMQHARDRSLRAEMYRGYATIASDQGDPQYDNSGLIERLLALRSEEASLLGFRNYACMRLETRMADDPAQVLQFLRQLAARAKPYGERDLAELQEFAKGSLGFDSLEPWDIAYVSERLRESRYAYSEEEVRQYFTEPRVLQGLFYVVGKLFGVTLDPIEVPVWHEDARAFEVRHNSGAPLGTLYLDLYARQGKQSGAWVDSERARRRVLTGVRTPVVYLTCNFSRPQNGRPSLLTHDDVITLFHESGHALHALLSEVEDPAASPFSSVEWDAIELPSQFMENFCWEWSVIQSLTAHVETGEPLPRTLYDKLHAARNFQSGMQMLRQVEFALFDMLIHQHSKGLSIRQVMDTLDEVRREVAVLFPPSWHRFPHNFSHLFAGGYGAGYYSYKWAEVLSADAYAAFEEAAGPAADGTRNTLHAATGQRFLREVLAVGGTRPAAESFEAFRGRAPTLDALLRHSGMTEEASAL